MTTALILNSYFGSSTELSDRLADPRHAAGLRGSLAAMSTPISPVAVAAAGHKPLHAADTLSARTDPSRSMLPCLSPSLPKRASTAGSLFFGGFGVKHHGPVIGIQAGEDGLTAILGDGVPKDAQVEDILQDAFNRHWGTVNRSVPTLISGQQAVRHPFQGRFRQKLFVIIIRFPALVSAFAIRPQNVHHPPGSAEIGPPRDCGPALPPNPTVSCRPT